MNLEYCLLAVPVAIAIELFVVSGAWDALTRWWARHNAWRIEDDDCYEISPLWRSKEK